MPRPLTDPVSPVAPSLERRASPGGRRAAVAALVGTLLVAAPAVALVGAWEPQLGRPGADPGAAATAATRPVGAAAAQSLAVLRRAQTARDRRLAEPLLRVLDRQTRGVQIAGIRALSAEWALVPVTTLDIGGTASSGDQLCITDGNALACASAETARRSGIGVTSADASTTRVAGLVPDGVAEVRYTPQGGSPVTAAVRSNLYSLAIGSIKPERLIAAPEGFDGPTLIPGPPVPIDGTALWLDDAGRTVGPG